MRTVDEIFADIHAEDEASGGTSPMLSGLWLEYYHTITDGILLDRLREICEAERSGRCVVQNPTQQPTTDPSVKPKCFYTELSSQYYCRGYCHGEDDDEPIEACKNCWWCDGNDDFRAEVEAALKKG